MDRKKPLGTTIFQRKRDRRFVARAAIRRTDGSIARKEFVGATEADVLRKLQDAKDSGMLRRAAYDQRPLKDFAEQWSEELKRSDYKATTIDGYKRDVRLYIVPYLGTTRLGMLDRKTVAAWMKKLDANGVGRAAIGRARRTLSRLLAIAVANDLIPTNPAQGLDRGNVPAYAAPEARTLTLEQIETLFQEMHHYRYGSMVIVAATTAARQSELIGLRWTDVDLDRRRIDIKRNLVLVNNRFAEGDPKTKTSDRTIALPAVAIAALRAHRKEMQREKRDVDTGLVWLTSDGNPVRRDNLLKETLYPALKRAALPRVTWHQLRHSCATALIELGVPLEAVSRTLGHANPGVTLKVYNKAFRGREHLASDALDAAFGKALTKQQPAKSSAKSGVKPGVKAQKSPPSPKVKTKKKPRKIRVF